MASDSKKPDDKEPKSESAESAQAEEKPATKTDADKGNDDLPEREPLTPELVEDEAIRGDFMMRWALVLLALMFGVTQILETETLVHIKSGQYTLQNLLPARTGIFSYTAEERPWSNLSWLFDAVLAGFYQLGESVGLGGDVLLSIFKGLLAATMFFILVHIGRREVSTWWGTICATIALLVCYRQFSAQPEIITLMGVTLTLSFLMRWREDTKPKHLKALAILFLVWSNLDPGMFYGLAVLLFYAIGEASGQWLGFAGLPNAALRKRLWITIGVCFAASLVNPFGWDTLLAPYVRYAIEYPALQEMFPNAVNFRELQYYGLRDPRFWDQIDSVSVAGLVLVATALVTFGLNFRRLDLGDVLLWLSGGAFAFIASHELAIAAIISGVLATTNAQDWYRSTFRQTYSVETSELLFSRGGRFVTVLALFGLAYLGVSGRLDRRVGVGFDPHLQGAIDAISEELDDSFDDRPFHFVPAQGDLLIWVDQKSFIDSRIGLYRGAGDDDLIALHQRTRNALRKSNQPGPTGRLWKPALDRFKITHVLPRLDSRLTQTPPDFGTFQRLAASRDWRLTKLGASTAVFYRTDLQQPDLKDYLKSNKLDFSVLTFRQDSDPPESRPSWAVGRSTYDELLSRHREYKPNAVELAEHYRDLIPRVFNEQMTGFIEEVSPDPRALIFSLLHAAIRNANDGLTTNPNSVAAFRVLGQCYMQLEQFELQAIQQGGGSSLGTRRDRQAMAALGQALILAPEDLPTLLTIAQLHARHRRFESAVESWERYLALSESETNRSESDEANRVQVTKDRDRVVNHIKRVKTALEAEGLSSLKSDADSRNARGRLVGLALSEGLVQLAISLMEDDQEWVTSDQRVMMAYLSLIQSVGRFEEAAEQLQGMDDKRDDLRDNVDLHNIMAYDALARADFLAAGKTWSRVADNFNERRLQSTFDAIPLTFRSPTMLARNLVTSRNGVGRPFGLWMTDQTESLLSTDRIAFSYAAMAMNVALSDLEAGQMTKAATQFQQIIDIAPKSTYAQLAGFYLRLTTGKNPLAVKSKPDKKKPKVKNAGGNESGKKKSPTKTN